MIKNLQNACNQEKTNGSNATIIKSWKTISTNHVDNKIYNDDKPKKFISGMPCKNNKMPRNLALCTSHEEPCTNDVNKKIHHSIKAKFFTIDMLSKK